MKKKWLLPLCWLPLLATAQTEVTPYTPGVTTDGVTYMLARTVLRIDVQVEAQHFTPGEFARYAERYLRLSDVGTEATDTYTIKNIHLDVKGEPDPSKIYSVKLKDKTVAPLIKLSESGLLLAINAPAEEYETFEGYPETVGGQKYNSRDYMTEEILTAGSTAKTAELCAQEIYNIRESKNALNRGQADFMPSDGKQMEIMVNNLNTQEAALLQLFAGYTLTETKNYTFYVDPEKDIQKQILFRFSQLLGVVDADDLSGAPIYLNVVDKHTVPAPVAAPEKPKKYTGVQYNMPGKAKIELYNAEQKLLDTEVVIAQFGNVETLDNTLFNKRPTTRIQFYDTNSGIKNIEQ